MGRSTGFGGDSCLAFKYILCIGGMDIQTAESNMITLHMESLNLIVSKDRVVDNISNQNNLFLMDFYCCTNAL